MKEFKIGEVVINNKEYGASHKVIGTTFLMVHTIPMDSRGDRIFSYKLTDAISFLLSEDELRRIKKEEELRKEEEVEEELRRFANQRIIIEDGTRNVSF